MPRTWKWDVAQAPYAASVVLFSAILIAITVANTPTFAWDFRAFYDAGTQYLHLHSPYVSGSLAQLTNQENYVYPLPFAALFAPISLIPYSVAAVIFVVASAFFLVLALRLLDVRDWRVYAAVAIGMPTATAVGLGTISPLLALLLALLWRFRDRDKVAAPVLALLVLAKLFLWPVGLWLLLTRRFRAVAAAVILSIVTVLLSAIPFGPGVLTHYVSLLRSLSAFEGPTSSSLSSLGAALSGSNAIGTGVMVASGLILLYAMTRAALRHEDERIFRLSVVAALATSPIVWNHYLVLLFVPLALVRPRFSPAWLAGAWLIGVRILDERTLEIATAAVWAVILIQGGLLSDLAVACRGANVRFTRTVAPLVAGIAQLGALIWLLGALTNAVPGVAALTPSGVLGHSSGTATLRFMKAKNEICWKIVTSGLPSQTRAEIVETDLNEVLVEHPMEVGKSVGCARYSTTESANVAMPFKRGQTHLSLRVTSPDGRPLLDGTIVDELTHLKVPAPESS
jgi:hypothetical protein